jgi:hypothetical protein
MTEGKSPLTVLFETLLFAPLGAALLAKEHLPKLATQGREHAESRVRVARMVGEFAVKSAKKEIERRLAPSSGQSTPTSTVAPEPTAGASSATTSSAVAGAPDLALDGQTASESVPSVDDLAIPGYDSLAASQVVERLAGLSSDELAAVRRYEAAMRHRRTILNRIDQLVS